MDDRQRPRGPAPGGQPPGGEPPPMPPPGAGPGAGPPPMPPPPDPPTARSPAPVRPALYARAPAVWRRVAAVIVGLICLGLAAFWLDWTQALVLWVLFSLFVVLWPAFPPLTAAEERTRAWPFEP